MLLPKGLLPGRKKVGGESRDIVISFSLCNALTLVAQIFGQTWDTFVVNELQLLLRQPDRVGGQSLTHILATLLRHADQSHPGLSHRFLLRSSQIRYQTSDRRYTLVIMQGEGDSVLLSWQMNVPRAGTSYIAYAVRGTVWKCESWEVSPQCQENLPLLAKAGGEVLGFLYERKLLPAGSIFQLALERQLAANVEMKEASSARPRPGEPVSPEG